MNQMIAENRSVLVHIAIEHFQKLNLRTIVKKNRI